MVHIPYTEENMDIFQDIKVKSRRIWIFPGSGAGGPDPHPPVGKAQSLYTLPDHGY